MGEEAKMSEYDGDSGGGDDERVHEWESGLPSVDDLTPLSQPLIPPELASAFSISPVPYRTDVDVNQASQDTFSSLRGGQTFKLFGGVSHDSAVLLVDDGDEDNDREEEEEGGGSGSDSRKSRRIDADQDAADSALPSSGDDAAARTLKRPRLVWTPQLHKRFVDVVGHLGIKNAVPKTIMQLMNVEGLTRENVASHLQKYRLYLKRMQGLSTDGPSPSDHLFSSAPLPPQSLLHDSPSKATAVSGAGGGTNGHHGHGHYPVPVPVPMPYPPAVMPMPMMGHGHMAMPPPPMGYHHGFDHHHHHHHHQYNMVQHQQRDWSANNYGSVVTYPHMAPSEN